MLTDRQFDSFLSAFKDFGLRIMLAILMGFIYHGCVVSAALHK